MEISKDGLIRIGGIPSDRAVKLILLSYKTEGKTRKMLLDEARRCNQCPRFPHHFLASML